MGEPVTIWLEVEDEAGGFYAGPVVVDDGGRVRITVDHEAAGSHDGTLVSAISTTRGDFTPRPPAAATKELYERLLAERDDAYADAGAVLARAGRSRPRRREVREFERHLARLDAAIALLQRLTPIHLRDS